MNVLSLFDGMACGRLALERAGVQVDSYYASEVDKYAIRVAQANYPDIQQVGDITQLRWYDPYRLYGMPEIDLMIGGSPCQGFSTGGSHLAFDDPRSKLFWEFIRLLDWVDPRWFLLENVRMKKEHENIITKYMGVDPVEVNSSLVSGQTRKRLYWTNIPFTVPEDRGIMLKDIIEDGVVDREKSHCLDAHYAKGGNAAYYFKKHRRQVVFKDTEMLPTSRYRMLTPLECERLQTVPEGYTAHVSNSQRYKMLGNGWTVDVVAHIFKNLGD